MRIDITGDKYGKLTAIKPSTRKTKGGGYYWLFRCDCGKEKEIPSNSVRSGLIKSCGCLVKPHGETKTRLHRIWVNMRMRCIHGGQYWGLKGISVCKEWEDYLTFKKWAMENGYSDNLTIDRIDGNGNYEPGNCRWATYKEQANNLKTNRKITINGETHNVKEWCELLQIVTASTVYRRVRCGWGYEEAITTPNQRKKGVWRLETK